MDCSSLAVSQNRSPGECLHSDATNYTGHRARQEWQCGAQRTNHNHRGEIPSKGKEMKTNIIIIGGGIIGSAAAYFLAQRGGDCGITVIEPDPTYGRATTPTGAGGVRRLMCRPENIRMSQYSLDFYADFHKFMMQHS